MFEARIVQGSQLKKIIEAIRELVVDANLDCNEAGITMQVRYLKSIDNGCSPEAAKVFKDKSQRRMPHLP
jgi:Proliferating cell nuclear antigen, N-terminal domain